MKAVVSANYRDRSQKNWLVRQQGDALDKYELHDRVVVKDFVFCKAHDEEGFGCKTVAVGTLEDMVFDPEQLVRIKFGGLRFVEDKTFKTVEGGRLLVLDDTGMYYLPV